MAKRLPDEVRKQIDKMTEAYRQRLIEIFEWSNDEEGVHPPTAAQIEEKIREWIDQLGEDTQMLMLVGMDRYRHKGKQPCPQCQTGVYWDRYEPRNYISTLGEIELERAYYHHAACHCGWVPMDERLEIGASELSLRVQEMLSYLGAFMPFDQAQTFLAKYCNIHVSHDTANNTTVAIGQALREKQEAEVRRAWEECCLPPCEVTTPPQRLYVSADGIKYLLPSGEGKEIKVANVYETEERQNQEGEIEIHAVDIEYVVATDPEDLARAVYLTAVKRGVQSADQIVVLGDGASWIWNRIAEMFPGHKTTEILDFYHASEYVWNAGKAMFGEKADAAKKWSEKYCHLLKHDGPAPVSQELRALSASGSSTPEPITKAITYFENQSPRMNYPLYVEQGLQIGSGSAESGVKQVVGCRINQAGMRWNPEHAEAVAHVRAAILSDRWDDFWTDFHPPPREYRRKGAPLPA